VSQGSNTSCSFSCILEIAEPPVSSGSWTNVLAYLYGTEYTDMPILSRPELFTVRLSFYNPTGIEFTVSCVCFCQGTLTVLECGSLLPVLSIRATSLIMYVQSCFRILSFILLMRFLVSALILPCFLSRTTPPCSRPTLGCPGSRAGLLPLEE